MKLFIFSLIPLSMFFAQSASALDVEVSVHNPCAPSKQCFQMDVYLDGSLTETWVTSPGNPNNNSGFKGSNTPEYTAANFTSTKKAGYVSSRGDSMPYAMHINGTGYAVHGSSLAVDGKKRSHGCLRIKTPNAKKLNAWVREAKSTGGLTTVTVRDTTLSYKK
ncbi:MAG: L,D-transpeptidase [Bdellovibrionaceae bacterium]|nr:L,D-transpeptidase [Pseudobdellovibrionaceae bacterium]